MQKKRNTRLKVNDFYVTLFCLIGSVLSILAFNNQLNKSLSKLNESPIATISFKYKSAQRKFIDRVLWDRLKQESPIYNGDTVRTAPMSEATISFEDGNSIVLYENTLIQVFKDEKVNLTFSQGDVSILTSETGTAMMLNTPISKIEVSNNSEIYAGGKEDLQVTVNEGSANINGDILEKGESKITNAQGKEISIPRLIISNPQSNKKILGFDSKIYPVTFEWKKENISEDTTVYLEIAKDKTFSNVVNRIPVTKDNSITLNLEEGIYYWKIYTTEGTEVINRLPICISSKPELISPAVGYQVNYRTRKPSVRFMWNTDKYISYWQLEISKDPNFSKCEVVQKCTQSSSIISSLVKGKYYWRIKPYYAINNIGFHNFSDVGQFEIIQNEDLKSCLLSQPAKNALVNTKIENSDKIYFSWKNNSEAVSYDIIVADNEQLLNPIVNAFTYDNFYTLDLTRYSLSNKKYYWSVNYTDNEGNISPKSEVRPFYGVEGELIQRTIFPPNEYTLNSDRTIDIKYTWKTNIPFETRYQIAKDKNFTEMVVDEVVTQTTSIGKKLLEGEYYWRLSSKTDELNLVTEPKKLNVVSRLEKTTVINPLNKSKTVARPMTAVNFSWEPVEGAHYYQVKLYSKDKKELIYELNSISTNNVDISLEDLQEAEYVWTIQAFAFETALSDRMSGMLTESSFLLKKLKPIVLEYPEDNKYYDGADALLHPDKVVWSSVDVPVDSEFLLYDDKDNVVMSVKNPKNTINLIQLREGTYSWIVKGLTYDNLDITSLNSKRIIVGKIEPLEAVSIIKPLNKQSFGIDYFKENTKIYFEWNKHNEADAYILSIYNKKNKEILNSGLIKVTYFTLDNLSILDKGSFTWKVEPVTIEKGIIFKRGKTNDTTFMIDLPNMKKTSVKKPGALYGK